MEMQELLRILTSNGLSTEHWFLTEEELLEEINNGDSALDNKGIRHFVVGQCRIGRPDSVDELLEVKQIFIDGRIRERMIPVSGKLKFNEDPFEGMKRELKEELDLEDKHLVSLELISKTFIPDNVAPSYIGLPTTCMQYVFRLVLPIEAIKSEYMEIASDRTSFFEWRPINQLRMK